MLWTPGVLYFCFEVSKTVIRNGDVLMVCIKQKTI